MTSAKVKVGRVHVKDDCIIPPMSEMLVVAKWDPVDATEMAMISIVLCISCCPRCYTYVT